MNDQFDPGRRFLSPAGLVERRLSPDWEQIARMPRPTRPERCGQREPAARRLTGPPGLRPRPPGWGVCAPWLPRHL